MKKINQTSNGAVVRIALAGFFIGVLAEYNRINGFEWPFLIGYAIPLIAGGASYVFLRKGFK